MFRRARDARPAAAGYPAGTRRGNAAAEDRLDPVRWRRPGRSALWRSAAVAALLATAAAVVHAREPAGCPPPGAHASPPAAATPTPGPAPGEPPGPGERSGPGERPGGGGLAVQGRAPGHGGPSEPGGGPDGPSGRAPRAVPRGSVGVPVRLAEPAALAVLSPGDRVDLLAAAAGGPAARIAANALVLGVGAADDPGAGLFLALTAEEARRAAATPDDARLSVLVRPPP